MNTPSQAQHTPTPWQVIPRETTPECCDFTLTVYDLHSIVSDSFPAESVSKPDAEFIVRAVNSHADLLAALERAAQDLEGSAWKSHANAETLEIVRQAIARAKGQA